MGDTEMYCIREGYVTNILEDGRVPIGNDNVEESMRFQHAVYLRAQSLIKKYKLRSVLDIGCGVGMKLRELIWPICKDINGIDEPGTIKKCKELHNFGRWYEADIERQEVDLSRKFDLIISADVIEHLIDPDKLISLIKQCSDQDTWIVLSTVDRDIARGLNHSGPPPNRGHYREWNFIEFRKYIESCDFDIVEHVRCPSVRLNSLGALRQAISKAIGKLKVVPSVEGSTQLMLLKRRYEA